MVEIVIRCINQLKLQFQHLLETRLSRCVRQAEVYLIHSVALCVATFLILLLHPSIVLAQSECGWAPPPLDPLESETCSIIHACDDPEFRDNYRYDTTQSLTYIRTMFHIIAEDDGANPASTPAIVEAQMNQLNNDFLSYGYQFTWDVRTINARWARYFDGPTFASVQILKDSFYIAPERQLNLIVTDITLQFTAFSQNPQFMNVLTTIGGQILSTFNGWNLFTADLSRHSLSHEIGHCLGLLHPYVGSTGAFSNCSHPCHESLNQAGNNLLGDYCADTPPQPAWGGATFAGAGIDICSGLPWPAITNYNYMNVANTAKSEFSFDQFARMNCFLENTMAPWVAGVRIKAVNSYGAYPLAVQFVGETTENITDWIWDFGNGNIDNVQNPNFVFLTPGVHTISVTADDADTTWSAHNSSFVAVYADTLTVNRSEVQSIGGVGFVDVSISARNLLPTSTFMIPLKITGSVEMTPQSVSINGLRTSSGNATLVHTDPVAGEYAVSVSLEDDYFPADTGEIIRIRFSVQTGKLDSNLVSVESFGAFDPMFTTYYGSHLVENVRGYAVRNSCCSGVAGNVDGDFADLVDIADLTFLIDHLFINFPPLNCSGEGNVDGDPSGTVDIADLTFLIDHLFINFPATSACQ